ncbi:MAG: DUF554 domain-containing protein [Propionibacteriaceae bacterium]|jgi:uncharacterized membrane protein YqgA involved in biofilm formation|nr:DUF554 domain-containing protein [Propionibacteriaceae bacterium]
MFIGAGTAINVATVLLGGGLGLLLGGRLPQRATTLVTQALGLFTIVLGADAVADGVTSAAFAQAVGPTAVWLVVLGGLVLGGVAGSLARVEDRFEDGAEWLRRRLAKRAEAGRFVNALVTATLVFCVGPLTLLGTISDGLGRGADQLIVKSVMDFFSSLAFAASMGVGVVFAAIPLAAIQGLLTLLGVGLGDFLSAAQLDSLTATGGVILIGLGLRLAGVAKIKVADLLPGLAVAPLLVWIIGMVG